MLKCMVSLRDFPYTSALFGLVSYNDPSKKRLQTSEIDPFFFWGGGRGLVRAWGVCIVFVWVVWEEWGEGICKDDGGPPFQKCWAMLAAGDDDGWWMSESGCEADNMTDMLDPKIKKKTKQATHDFLGAGFKYWIYCLCSPRKLGKIPILTHIFQMGWNHQPVFISHSTLSCWSCSSRPSPFLWVSGSLVRWINFYGLFSCSELLNLT